jgi:hypothetical protein
VDGPCGVVPRWLGDSVALVALLRYVAGTVGTGPAVAVLMLSYLLGPVPGR